MLGKKLIIPVVLIALACSLWADPPVKLQYQGKITQNDIALNGLYDMTFRLYSGSCGGTLLWTEIHNGASQVQVTNGLFNVLLGDITAFPEVSTTFNQPLWLQITVGATVMSPCEAFNPVPYAMYAISSPGSGSVNYWSPNGTHIYSNNTGNVGIGTTDPVGKLAVRQNMTAIGSSFTSPHIKIMASNTVDNTGFVGITYAASTSENYGWSSGALRSTGGQSDFLWKHHSNSALGTEYMRITSTGNVGIATPSPSYKLDVNGDLRVNSPSFPGRDYRISCAGRQEIYANNDLVEFVDGNKCVVVGADGGANDDFFIAVNNEATKFFTADGTNQRIGIGTNAPSTKLDVDGTVRIRGGSPAAGRVLTASDANGNATWTTGSSNFIQNLGGIGTTPQQARWRLSWPFTVSTSSDTLTYLLCRPASWNSDAVIYGNLVDIGTVTDGHGQAYYGKVDGSYSSLTGTTAFSGATFSAWDASGNARGGAGSVSISTLRTSFADHNATAYGLTGTANGSALTPSAASGANRMAIVGVHAELNGTINNPATMPDTFRVAALWAVDNKTGGTATSYAGFFDGNVYIDGDLTVTGTGGGGGTIGGSGTTNYITKWNPASTTISNSIIYDNGTNVGIGTGTTTNYKLDIVGGTTSNTALRLRTHGTGTGQETILRFTNTTNNDATNQYSSYIAGIRTDAGGGQALAFGTSTSSAAPVERMRIDPSGNLGIGTTGPTATLDVVGRTTIHPSGTTADNAYNGNLVITKPAASAQYINLIRSGNYPWSIGTVYNSSNFAIGPGNATESSFSPYFVLTTAGNVGIGTTGPLSKLSVNAAGDALYAGYVYGTSTTTGAVALRGENVPPTAGGNHAYGVQGVVTSGTGWSYGVLGSSSGGGGAAGRAYGVRGQAGGATSGYNYAVIGELLNGSGTGNGAAIIGVDLKGGYSLTQPLPGTYAGWFDGRVRTTGTLQVGNYILPTADGASGQVLKTNGSGTLSWQADNTGAGGDNLGNHTATQNLNMNYWDIRNIDDLDGAESGEVGYIYLNWNCAGGGQVGVYNSDLYVQSGYGITLGGEYRTSWPAGGSSQWEDAGIYKRVIGNDAVRAYESGQAYGLYGSGSSYGVYGVATSGTSVSGFLGWKGITDYGWSDAGIYGDGNGWTFGVYGRYNATNYGFLGGPYGAYGYYAGNYGYLGGSGYGVYGYGTSYGVYGQGGTYAGYFNGNVRSTGTLQVGNYILPTADGASGQVLKTNGSGTLSWQADNTGAGGDNLGNHTATMGLNMNGQSITSCPYYNVSAANGYGLRFWSSDSYKIHMGNSAEYLYGPVTDYSIKTNMSNNAGRGWTWGVAGSTPVAAINIAGNMQIAGDLTVAGADIYNGSSSYSWNGSGNWNTFRTPSGYIQLGPANASWAHIYSDKLFYFNQELYVNGNRVWHDGYHPAGGSNWTDAGTYIYPNASTNFQIYDNTSGYTGMFYVPSVNTSAVGYLMHGTGSSCYLAYGNTYGLYGYSGTYGVYGAGGSYGVYGNGTSYGVYGTSGSWAGYFSGNSYTSGYLRTDNYLNMYYAYNGIYDYNGSYGSGLYLKSMGNYVLWQSVSGGGSCEWEDAGTYKRVVGNDNVRAYEASQTYSLYGSASTASAAYGYYGYASYTGSSNPSYSYGGYFYSYGGSQDGYGVYGYFGGTASQNGGYLASSGGTVRIAYRSGTGTFYKITGSGTVSEVIPTKDHGRITLMCPESPEYWYQDFGSGRISEGVSRIELDPILKDICVIDSDNPIKVLITPKGRIGEYWVESDQEGFTLFAPECMADVGFDYMIITKPKTNYGSGRFVQAPGPGYLKPENDPPAAKAANQGADTVWIWPPDHEVYDYEPADYCQPGGRVEGGKFDGYYKDDDGKLYSPEEYDNMQARPSLTITYYDEFGNQIPPEWVEEFKAEGVPMFNREEAEARRKQAYIDNARAVRKSRDPEFLRQKEEERKRFLEENEPPKTHHGEGNLVPGAQPAE